MIVVIMVMIYVRSSRASFGMSGTLVLRWTWRPERKREERSALTQGRGDGAWERVEDSLAQPAFRMTADRRGANAACVSRMVPHLCRCQE